MSDVKITVGGAMEEEASRRFVDAWHRAERGRLSMSAILRLKVGKLSPGS
jgi:hypothetical protein